MPEESFREPTDREPVNRCRFVVITGHETCEGGSDSMKKGCEGFHQNPSTDEALVGCSNAARNTRAAL